MVEARRRWAGALGIGMEEATVLAQGVVGLTLMPKRQRLIAFPARGRAALSRCQTLRPGDFPHRLRWLCESLEVRPLNRCLNRRKKQD
jgi:hypothetical protein